ncbi:hypothetical protein Q4543_17705 [Salipiger sp. 1_MG-2023]|uniref:hypothetical protein n=1 Tax=Salipiger sp. 1_MG-2023 TaxID=3062665 RepID=UPI0026E3FB5F|nr:hypothetical protein [Salipiger sp. 1_MG-2023]MDO6587351.1 hypothetical protein [Salipiger sp. 1_MG-2023]
MTDLATKADTYAARIELLAASPEPDAGEKLRQELRLLRTLLAGHKPAVNRQQNKGVRRG